MFAIVIVGPLAAGAEVAVGLAVAVAVPLP
jgi:hypothetical protein